MWRPVRLGARLFGGYRVMVAERFRGPPRLAELTLPLDTVPPGWAGTADIAVFAGDSEQRRVGVQRLRSRDRMSVRFPAFDNDQAAMFTVVLALDADGVPMERLWRAARSARDRAPITLDALGERELAPTDAGLQVGVELVWLDRDGLYLQGWVHAAGRAIHALRVEAGDGASDIAQLSERPDVLALTPHWPNSLHSGFAAYVAWREPGPVVLTARTDEGPRRQRVPLPDQTAPPPSGDPIAELFNEVNARGLTVAEIGARRVSAKWADSRVAVPGARRFVGVDIHPGPGVDLVGDAHALDTLLEPGSMGAVFSSAVIEHLSHPWLFAAAVNRVLEVGGITFHGTHQSWPLHEEPNDFWRFSDAALRVLFGPETGFEVIRAGMMDRIRLHPVHQRPEDWLMPLVSAYGHSFVLARKVRDLAPDAVRWPRESGALEARARAYPRREA